MYRAGLLTGTPASALMFSILTTTWKDQGPSWSVQATVAEIHIHCLCNGEGYDDLVFGRELLLDKEGDRKRDASPDWS